MCSSDLELSRFIATKPTGPGRLKREMHSVYVLPSKSSGGSGVLIRFRLKTIFQFIEFRPPVVDFVGSSIKEERKMKSLPGCLRFC